MKHDISKNSKLSALSASVVLGVGQAEGATIWSDPDPLSGTSMTGGPTIVTSQVDGTNLTMPSDPSRDSVVAIDTSGAQFTNVNVGVFPGVAIDSSLIGQPFSFSADFLIPNDTTWSLAEGDNLFGQVQFFDAAGMMISSMNTQFPNASSAGAWGEITTNGVVPADTASIFGLIIFGDNGAQAAGPAVYLDNILLEVTDPVPEPSSVMLVGLGALGLLRRRR